MFLFFLSSGLFLGWTLGANDASNVFGSAVGSKMIRFRQAAIVASIFVVLGAVIQGSGASHTLEDLGSVSALGGAFTVALAAGISVFWMTKSNLPVSTSQAIVGAIIGWNLFTGNPTNYMSLTKIVSTWVSGPILGGIFAILLFLLLKYVLHKSKIHLIKLDAYLKYGLLIVGAFGAYSLGANNIANVVGVFVPSVPNILLDFGFFKLNGTQLLFLAGGFSIAMGILTYSKKVMMTVGNSLMRLNAETALVVVLAHSIVLFVFSSQSLSNFFVSMGLPAIPLVPVSSSQVIVGSILGIGILKGGRTIQLNVVGKIALGWLLTPIIAGLIAFFALFFMSNVFNLKVSENPSRFVKGDVVVDNTVNHAYDSATKKIESLDLSAPEPTKINLYKPAVVLFIVVLLALILYQLYIINKLKERSKIEEHQEHIERYNVQQMMLETELKITTDANLKLEKEIHSKEKDLKKIALDITKKNEILSTLKEEIQKLKQKPEQSLKYSDLQALNVLILDTLNIDNERNSLDKYLKELNNSFYQNLEKKYPELTENDKKLCSLLRLKLSSKEIASILNIIPKSVEVNRYRLRRKMGLEKNDKLIKILRKL
ncbi:inorganic phosphate transporter [Mariniflexile maritimum]|uniref:inorganic phosphate transporter n=1 Tax=Mariniflexile maritimum TaxID=2682493 RepID=UPI0012F646D6|nr:inorganic phosphate transporter [Mariniflexile maritimum]